MAVVMHDSYGDPITVDVLSTGNVSVLFEDIGAEAKADMVLTPVAARKFAAALMLAAAGKSD